MALSRNIILISLVQYLLIGSSRGFQTPLFQSRKSCSIPTRTKLYESNLPSDDSATYDTDPANPCIIQVLGVGGGGGNAVNRMIDTGIQGVSFWSINTDAQALGRSSSTDKLNIGREVTKGLGAGGKPEVGREAAQESYKEIEAIVKGSDMVFIAAGMGGGTGSGAAPVVAEIAKDTGCLTVAIVTKPFGFEARLRMKQAEEGIENLRKHCDTVIVISNNKLLRIVPDNTPVTDAFLIADDILRQGVLGITEIILKTGLINIDFADVESIMKDAGNALMGVGSGVGENKAKKAAIAAISSPLLDIPFAKSRRILSNIVGGPKMTMREYEEASGIIRDNAINDARIIIGCHIDPEMGEEIAITVIAADFVDEDTSNEKKDASFYKDRRLATASPLGEEAISVEETTKAITRGFIIDDDEPPVETQKRGWFSKVKGKLFRRN